MPPIKAAFFLLTKSVLMWYNSIYRKGIVRKNANVKS